MPSGWLFIITQIAVVCGVDSERLGQVNIYIIAPKENQQQEINWLLN